MHIGILKTLLFYVFTISACTSDGYKQQTSNVDDQKLRVNPDEHLLQALALGLAQQHAELSKPSAAARVSAALNAAADLLRNKSSPLHQHHLSGSHTRLRGQNAATSQLTSQLRALLQHWTEDADSVQEQTAPSRGHDTLHIPDLKEGDVRVKNARNMERLMWPRSSSSSSSGGPAPELKPMPLHWVITSCGRQMWGRHLASTLLSGVFMGIMPTTITVLMCDHMPKERLPTLLHNLQYSRRLRVIYLPEAITKSVISNYLLALSIPYYYGRPHIPLLISEDDVLFTPDFNIKLRHAAQKVEEQAQGRPYMVNLYGGNAPDYDRPTMDVITEYRSHVSAVGGRGSGLSGLKSTDMKLVSGKHAYWFGGQGLLYSPAMVHKLLQHWIKVVQGEYTKTTPGGPIDVVLHDFLDVFSCFFTSNPGCVAYRVEPSMVEHVGVSSAMWGGVNNKSRFHMSFDFPWKVEFPALDPQGEWRRRRGRRRAA